ncbi:MAG: aminotransferase class III-fold pyridoxal phosphate-dependent enzyme [Dehalococcoidia bacterium]|jgi:glutamate-1-semialdehyde 2,1-aminomutase|nr:aminotransferase class III-fold pyridoxal phosphate-dependent enzyme [Dehalococcoidia bacterium]
MKKHNIKNSLNLYKKAEKIIPGKTQLISRRSSQFAHGINPIYAKESKGAYFIDVDDNKYLDWMNAVSAIILGHSNDYVDNAVKKQIDKGSIHTVNSSLEIELAELLINEIPSAEMVRYTKGGGDSCTLAVRIARGTTGRDKILFSGYHGWHDWYQAANYLVNPEDGEFPFAGIEPIGVPKVLKGTAMPFIYGDIENLKELIKIHGDEVAAIMLEPMRSEFPESGYLEEVKRLAKENGSLLIFDEVSCGWRMSVGGAQKKLGVTPDITAFAKAMSNGYPMGAVVGSKEAMGPADRMFVSSSYWSDNIGLAASYATIEYLLSNNSEKWFEDYGIELKNKITDVMSASSVDVEITGIPSSPIIQFNNNEKSQIPLMKTLFVQEMAKQGIHMSSVFHPTMSHDINDIKITCTAIDNSLSTIEKALNSNFEDYLEAPILNEPFRRLVK